MKRLPAALLLLLIFLCFASLAAAEPDPIGEVQTFRGTAVAVHGGQKRVLALGDKLFRDETVATAAESFLQIMFADGTVMTLDQLTEMALNDVAYSPMDAGNSVFDAEMVAGTCRFVTGQITKHNPERFKIGSPLGIIGIRGTEGGVSAAPDNASAYGASLGAAIGAQGSGWSPAVAPSVTHETVAHFNGTVSRPMSFTDHFGKTVEIARGMAVDVSADRGAGAPRGVGPEDREMFKPASFSTAANVPSRYRVNFRGYDSSPGSVSSAGGTSGGGDKTAKTEAASEPHGYHP